MLEMKIKIEADAAVLKNPNLASHGVLQRFF